MDLRQAILAADCSPGGGRVALSRRWGMLLVACAAITVLLLLDAIGIRSNERDSFQGSIEVKSATNSSIALNVIYKRSKLKCPPLGDEQIPWVRFRPHTFLQGITGGTSDAAVRRKQSLLENDRLLKVRLLDIRDDPSSNSSAPPRSVYYHIHKVGGTTMSKVLLQIQKSTNAVRVEPYYVGQKNGLGSDLFHNRTRTILEALHDRQQVGDADVSLFTFVRDPAKRFVSSVGQVLINRQWHALESCGNQTITVGFLECILDKMLHPSDGRQSFDYLNEHLVPQFFELYNGLEGYDIQVDTTDLMYTSPVLRQCAGGSYNVSKLRSGTVQKRYPQFDLQNASYTDAMYEKLCLLYEVDVLMLRHLASLRPNHDPNARAASYCR